MRSGVRMCPCIVKYSSLTMITQLRINSLGDAESRDRYRAVLSAYLEPLRLKLSASSLQRYGYIYCKK